MAKRDFHFKHENNNPVKQKPKRFKKPNPSPPMNYRRNPSANVQETSPYDSVEEKKVLDRVEEIEVNIGDFHFNFDENSEDDINKSKLKREENPGKENAKSKKLMIIAAIFVALGVCFVGIGIYIGLNFV